MTLTLITLNSIIILYFISLYFPLKRRYTIHLFYTALVFIFLTISVYAYLGALPIVLLVGTTVNGLYLLIVNRHILNTTVGRKCITYLMRIIGYTTLFTIVTSMIGYLSIPIISPIASWFLYISISALLTFSVYGLYTHRLYHRSFETPVDYILVLGAGIFTEEVTPMLRARLDRAYDVYKQQQTKPHFILSGGQGPDEPISEACAMYRYLRKRGVPDTHITLEDQSTRTIENIRFSKQHIAHTGQSVYDLKTLCVTSQFHILRALRFGQQAAWPFEGIGSKTPLHFLHVALIRDYLALMYTYRITLTFYFATLFFVTTIIPCLMWILTRSVS